MTAMKAYSHDSGHLYSQESFSQRVALLWSYLLVSISSAFRASVGVNGSCQRKKQRWVCEEPGCWWWCIIQAGKLLNMACIPAPSPLLIEINDPDIHLSLRMNPGYSDPQIIKSFNAGKVSLSSSFRQCNVNQANELWPLNHKADWLRHPHVVYTQRLSNRGLHGVHIYKINSKSLFWGGHKGTKTSQI